MDYGLNETQEMLKSMARDFLTKECPDKVVREMERDKKGYLPEMWKKMAALGWMGLVFPERYGGGAGSFLDLAVLLEEMGRRLLPGPFFSTVVLAGLTILDLGNDDQKEELLPGIIRGENIATLALTEPGAAYSPDCIKVKAVQDGNDYIISGTKLFVPDAHIADFVLCIARTDENTSGNNGISAFLVDTGTPGISCVQLKTLAGDKQCELNFDNVRVPGRNLLGEFNNCWPGIEATLRRAAIGKCAEMIGGSRYILEMVVDYVKQRVQFGHPLGSFQSIQNYCVQISTDVVTSQLITHQAAWKISEGIPCEKDAAIAKAWVSDAYKRITTLGHQCLGGLGYMLDSVMPLYTERAWAAEMAFGDADYHRELVAGELGL